MIFNYGLVLLALQVFLANNISCCGCGKRGGDAHSPPRYYENDYENLGIKCCSNYEIPSFEIQQPICPPPAPICTEFGISPHTTYSFPSTDLGDLGLKRMKKKVRYPVYASRIDRYNQRVAINKQSSSGYSSCGCGCTSC